MPKYRMLLQAVEANVHEVVITSDEALTKAALEDLAVDAFFGRDLPEGVREKTRFNIDGEIIEGPEVYLVEEVKE